MTSLSQNRTPPRKPNPFNPLLYGPVLSWTAVIEDSGNLVIVDLGNAETVKVTAFPISRYHAPELREFSARVYEVFGR